MDYEHSETLAAAQQALINLRHATRTLWWMSGGRGYDNMGRRELEHVRTKLDEADHWLAAASRSLNAGGARSARMARDTWTCPVCNEERSTDQCECGYERVEEAAA